MRAIRAVAGHPVTVIVLAIGAGMLIHRLTSSTPRPGAELATQNVPPDAPATATATADPATEGAAPLAHAEPERPTAEPLVVVEERPEPVARPAPPPSPAPDPATAPLADPPPEPPPVDGLEPVSFREIWGYLMDGEDARWVETAPITDLCLFNFRLGHRGEVIGEIDPETLQLARKRGVRTHLVIASSGQKSLLHFVLNPNYRAQHRFLGDILSVVRRHEVDGLQLDFEGILPEDRWNFIAFVKRLRDRLPGDLIFSLALPAEVEVNPNRPLRYRGLADIADRFLIMVYDQHWKGGKAGSISSRDWHDRVVRHALQELPAGRVIVGLPLYGRIWQKETVARATRYPDIERLTAEYDVTIEYDADRTHHFKFQRTVTAECWFEDAATLHAKFSSASKAGAVAVGFWRLGQEDARVWPLLTTP